MSKLDTETQNAWVTAYDNTRKLPASKIPCSNDGCDVQTTMFGDNLHKRVLKFGTVENLLNTFECKTCRQKAKVAALAAKFQAKNPVAPVVDAE